MPLYNDNLTISTDNLVSINSAPNYFGGGGGFGTTLNDRDISSAITRLQQYTSTFPDSPLKYSEKEKNKVGIQVLNKIKATAIPMIVTEKDGEVALTKADEYRALGLEYMARIVEQKTNRILREIGISAAGYKRINRTELDKFQKELREISDSTSKRRLEETPLAHYIGQNNKVMEGEEVTETELGVPPQEVLDKLKVARDSNLFDDYAVLHIQYVPDPILCGKIEESSDLYFIAEWGDDVKLSDIVK